MYIYIYIYQASTDEIDGIMAVISELNLLPEKLDEQDPGITSTAVVLAQPPSPPPSQSPSRSSSLSPLRLESSPSSLVFVMQGENLRNEIRVDAEDVIRFIYSAGGDEASKVLRCRLALSIADREEVDAALTKPPRSDKSNKEPHKSNNVDQPRSVKSMRKKKPESLNSNMGISRGPRNPCTRRSTLTPRSPRHPNSPRIRRTPRHPNSPRIVRRLV